MKPIFTIITLFYFSFSFSQNILIEYNLTVNSNQKALSYSKDYTLLINNNKSLFYNGNNDIDKLNDIHYIKKEFKAGDVSIIKIDDYHYGYEKKDAFYKDYVIDTLLYNEVLSTKKRILGEKINLFKWELQSKSDTLILGFKCQKALTKFRGRNYVAYFSNEIAHYGGPWKFDGLPGVILSVKSTDDYFIIEPKKIILNKKNNFLNPYSEATIYSWLDFRNQYISLFKKQLKRAKASSEPGETGSIKISDRIEDLKIPEMKY